MSTAARTAALQVRLRAVSNRMRESLFFIPSLLIVAGALAACAAVAVDQQLQAHDLPRVLRISLDPADTLLATIAGATITTVGVVFSITVVSVQLASGQFSPRVVRGFFRDRYAQVVIGVLAATFAFCVLSMFGLTPGATLGGHVPLVTTALAVLLAFASIVTIVIYLDHSARALYVGAVADRVMDESLALIRGGISHARHGRPLDADQLPALDTGDAHVVMSRGDSGWVQQMNTDGIVAAVPEGSVMRLETRAGAYVTTGTPLAVVSPAPPDPERVDADVNAAIALGAERTMQEDVDFGIRQLVDIGLRALSPAVNDPTTAVEVVVRLGTVVHDLLAVDVPAAARRYGNGTVVLRPLELRHDDYLRHAFMQLRRASVGHPVVVVALVRTLRMLEVTASARGREDAAHAAADVIDGCLELADRSDLLPDEQAMVDAAARTDAPLSAR